jgi:hypothetical protein
MSETLKLVDINAQMGIRSELHEEDGKVVIKKTYDAEPFLEHAAELRAVTRGDNWGPYGRKVGTIPMAELAKMMRNSGDMSSAEFKKEVRTWLQQRPAFVTFDKFLKK